MKRTTALIVSLLLICTFAVSAAEAPVSTTDITVYIDGEKIEFDVQPNMINSRVMVPMRFIFEKLGAKVNYDGETQTVSAFKSDEKGINTIVLIQINNPRAFVNNDTFELDSPPIETDGRTLVPIRFVGEALGCTVDWNEEEWAVYITSKKDDTAIEGEEADEPVLLPADSSLPPAESVLPPAGPELPDEALIDDVIDEAIQGDGAGEE